MNATTWTAPVATPAQPRYFKQPQGFRRWVETDPNAEPELDGDTTVVAYPVAGGFRIVCDCYYSSEGRFEMTITRPLAEALTVFLAALAADSDVEDNRAVADVVALVA